MANLLDGIINYLADAVVKDSNGNATVEGTLTVEGHSTPIGSSVTSGVISDIPIASGGSLKSTGITVTLPAGVWIISYYASFGANVANSTYKGIALRYKDVGATSWTTWTASQMTISAWSSASEVNPAIATSIGVTFTSDKVVELIARSNPAITLSGRIVAFRIA